MVTQTTISVYRVGLFDVVRRYGRIAGTARWIRAAARHARRGNWRAIKSSLNGYLAEVNYPNGLRHRTAGHGWTKRRAASSLGHYLVRDNPDRIFR